METAKIFKSSKWFSNKSVLRLNLHRRRSKCSSTSLSYPASSPESPQTPNKRTKRAEDEMREVFRYFDGDGDGKISALELRAYFGSIGEYMSHEDAQGVINDLDSDGDSMLDYQDFLKLMKREACNDDDLKKAFEMFELEKGSGCITPKGLQKMLNRLGDAKSYDECVAMIQAYDTDGNGVLDFHEFHRMMA
ncbi:probable calcium-binding protein CML41 [Durio zibethinus]|uniref:Probable calcium-binding protein CML41 n=1 Tax=Durio zibethinus TaxID=66656 RepID=A0A6P5YHV3_DURZI|nr:probable calcium-binding protein CML41 [Durio zibethinus]